MLLLQLRLRLCLVGSILILLQLLLRIQIVVRLMSI